MADTPYKVSLGIELSDVSLNDEIRRLRPTTPITLNVRLNDQPVLQQIQRIRRQIQQLSGIRINLGAGNGGSGVNRVVNEVDQAYNDLMNLQRRISSIRIKIAGLDETKNSGQIQELRHQLNGLMTDYNNLFNTFTNSRGLDMEQLNTLDREIYDVTVRLEQLRTTEELFSRQGIDISTTRQNIQLLENELAELRATYERFSGGLSIEQINRLTNGFDVMNNKVSAINAKMADTAAIKAQTQAFKDLSAIQKEIGSLEFNIAK